uniref:Peptidase S1 domain-containing protein n=1 Tax=Romanomermis culicivorax TaxID=13658 RepID=A0A915HJY0_ROMCU
MQSKMIKLDKKQTALNIALKDVQGDSGGPIFCRSFSNDQVLFQGIISSGTLSPVNGYTIAEQIYSFVPWINRLMNRRAFGQIADEQIKNAIFVMFPNWKMTKINAMIKIVKMKDVTVEFSLIKLLKVLLYAAYSSHGRLRPGIHPITGIYFVDHQHLTTCEFISQSQEVDVEWLPAETAKTSYLHHVRVNIERDVDCILDAFVYWLSQKLPSHAHDCKDNDENNLADKFCRYMVFK